jgi:hypothetical protein
MANMYELQKHANEGFIDYMWYGLTHPVSVFAAINEKAHGQDPSKPLFDHTIVDDDGKYTSTAKAFDLAVRVTSNQLVASGGKPLYTKEQLQNREAEQKKEQSWHEAFSQRIRELSWLDHIPSAAVKQWLDDMLSKNPGIKSKAASQIKQYGLTPGDMDVKYLNVNNKEELEHYAKLLDAANYLAGGDAAKWIVGDPNTPKSFTEQLSKLGGKTTPEIAGWAAGTVANDALDVIKGVTDALGDKTPGGFWDAMKSNAIYIVMVGVGVLILIKKV